MSKENIDNYRKKIRVILKAYNSGKIILTDNEFYTLDGYDDELFSGKTLSLEKEARIDEFYNQVLHDR